ncbi:MAG: glycosyltransferase [Bacteroidota bacterium]
MLASDGRALHLLRNEFPELPLFQLPSYGITYRTSNMYFNMALQFPKMLKAIVEEKKEIEKIVKEQHIDIIISDNRYGCFSQNTYNVFLTHQINLPIPLLVVRQIADWINRSRIKKFDECWIPDFEKMPNLSGKLSHGEHLFKIFKKIKYIGALSRMQFVESRIKRKAIIILSGPEPQRTYLEEKILAQAAVLPFKFLLVKGQTERKEHFYPKENIEVISFLTAKKLNQAIAESEVVISRSGYTTLMDLVFLGKRAILIPTPGQTEQEYLAHHFHEQKTFYRVAQKDFNLSLALRAVEKFTGFEADTFQDNEFEKYAKALLQT